MSRNIILTAIFLVLAWAVTAGADPMLLVVNQKDNSLQVFNATTYNTIAIIQTGRGPHEVVVSPDGKFAYVSNFESGDNTVSVIDLKTLVPVKAYNIEPVWGPHGMAMSRNGSRLFVTAEKSRSIVAINTATGELTGVYSTGELLSHMCALVADEGPVITSNSGSGNLTFIDLKSGDIVRRVRTGDGADGLAIRPGADEIWVTNPTQQTISVIDLKTYQHIASIECNGSPNRVEFTSDGSEAWVTCPTLGRVFVYEADTHAEKAAIRTGSVPIALTAEPDGKRVFVSNRQDNDVVAIDRTTYKVIKRLPVGKSPDGLAFVP